MTNLKLLGKRILFYTAAAFIGGAILGGSGLFVPFPTLDLGLGGLEFAGLGSIIGAGLYFLYSTRNRTGMDTGHELIAALVPLVLSPLGGLVVGALLYLLG
jgi:hypothetical protein